MGEHDEDAGGGSEFRAWFGWTWLVAAASTIIAMGTGVILADVPGASSGLMFIAGVMPPLALLGLLAYAYFGGRRTMAQGVLAAMGSMFALMLLLVAACFGLVAGGGLG